MFAQALWKGYYLRKQLESAYNYARCDFNDDPLGDGELDWESFNFDQVGTLNTYIPVHFIVTLLGPLLNVYTLE